MHLNELPCFPEPQPLVQAYGLLVSPVHEENDSLILFKQSFHMGGDDRTSDPPAPVLRDHIYRPDLAALPVAGVHPCKSNRFLLEKDCSDLTPLETPSESELCPDSLNLGPAYSELLYLVGLLKRKEDTSHLRRRPHTGVTAGRNKMIFIELHIIVFPCFSHTHSGRPQESFYPLLLPKEHGCPGIPQGEKGPESHCHLLPHFRQEEEMKILPIFRVHKPHIRPGLPYQVIFVGSLPSGNCLIEIEVDGAILF